jgi:putative DNA primase/helicase
MEDLWSTLERHGYDTRRIKGKLIPGKPYRMPGPDEGPKGDSGWLILHSYDAATFGDWRTEEKHHWFADKAAQHAPPRVIPRKPHQKTKEAEQKDAAVRARNIWHSSPSASTHPYASIKGISVDGLRIDSYDNLLVPMFDGDKIVNLQMITPEGEKRFLKNGKKDGCYFILPGDGPRDFAEGYATAFTVREATGRPTVVTFDAGNLPKVVNRLSEPGSRVFADNDNKCKGGKRKTSTYGKGHKAAIEAGLPFYMPTTPGDDFNDIGVQAAQQITSQSPISNLPIIDAWGLKKSELKASSDAAMRSALKGCSDQDELARMAYTVADRMSLQVPIKWSLMEVRMFLEENTRLHPMTLDNIIERCQYTQNYRKQRALGFSNLSSDAIKGHDHEFKKDLRSLSPDDYRGVIVVKSPMGTGKTQKIGNTFIDWAKKEGLNSVSLSPRSSLAGELSVRLNVADYQKIRDKVIPPSNHVAICSPSIGKPEYKDIFSHPYVVFADEITQILRFFQSKDYCRTKESTNEDVYQQLVDIVKNAACVVVADAGVNDRVIQFLEQCRPNEKLRIIEVEPKNRGINAKYSNDEALVIGEVLSELESGGKAWIASESSEKVPVYAALLREYGYKVLHINGDNKGNKEQSRFLEDVDLHSKEYDAVIASPIISSGVSVQHEDGEHFTLGAFFGSGRSIIPSDAIQMPSRVRYLKRFVLCLTPNSQPGSQSSESVVKAWEDASILEGKEVSANSFDRFIADLKADESNQKSDFSASVVWLLEQDGWNLSRLNNSLQETHKDELSNHKKETRKRHTEALMQAPAIDNAKAYSLSQMDRTETQNIMLEAYRIREELRTNDLTDELIEFWNGGRAIPAMARYSAFKGVSPHEDDSDNTLSSRKFGQALVKSYKYLFDGIDTDGHWLNEETANVIIDRVMKKRHLLAHLGIVSEKYGQWKIKGGKVLPMNRPLHVVREVGEIFKKMGLKTKGKQSRGVHTSGDNILENNGASVYKEDYNRINNRRRVYCIDPVKKCLVDEIMNRRNYLFTLNGGNPPKCLDQEENTSNANVLWGATPTADITDPIPSDDELELPHTIPFCPLKCLEDLELSEDEVNHVLTAVANEPPYVQREIVLGYVRAFRDGEVKEIRPDHQALSGKLAARKWLTEVIQVPDPF